MKQLGADETDFLFERVKNWYPTNKKPKTVICLLNEQEWKDFYEKGPKINADNARKELTKINPEFEALFNLFDKLPKEQREKILGNLDPHNLGATIDLLKKFPSTFEGWMNEVSGVAYSMAEQRYGVEKGIISFLHPFFKPFIDTFDFVIVISNFLSGGQRKIASSRKTFNFYLYSIIFHELIHVVEHCEGITILKSGDPDQNFGITEPIATKYFS